MCVYTVRCGLCINETQSKYSIYTRRTHFSLVKNKRYKVVIDGKEVLQGKMHNEADVVAKKGGK